MADINRFQSVSCDIAELGYSSCEIRIITVLTMYFQ